MSENLSQTPTNPPLPPTLEAEDKTIAIVAYLTIIGFIVAIVLHMNKKTKLGAYHLRQVLGFVLSAVVLGAAGMILAFIPILGGLVMLAVWAGLFVLWILGLVAAINGQKKPMPLVGELYQKWFGNTFD